MLLIKVDLFDKNGKIMIKNFLISKVVERPTGITPYKLFSWGGNEVGQLGQNDTTTRSSPVQVGALTSWISASSGLYHSTAIKDNYTVWSWGYNEYGALGLGDTTNRSSPVQVGALTNWKKVSTGDFHTISIKTDGTLWAWGLNSSGELGLGDTTDRSSPVQVGALTNWKEISANSRNCLAIKTDGTLWSWGGNTTGALGLGDTTDRSSPVQVGALTTWKQVSSGNQNTMAIKTDGTLWGWGNNYDGALGLGDTTDRSSPVQVGGLTTWKQVSIAGSAQAYGHTLAVKTDGTLWAWGAGGWGQLGNNDSIDISSPIQVGSDTDWDYTYAGGGQVSFGIKTNATLWAWGINSYGQLGINEEPDQFSGYSTPQQVGYDTNWKIAECNYNGALGLKL